MTTYKLDTLGMKCPQPILKVATKAKELQAGDMLEVKADCESFQKDIEAWCKRTNKTLLFCADEGDGKFKAQIQF